MVETVRIEPFYNSFLVIVLLKAAISNFFSVYHKNVIVVQFVRIETPINELQVELANNHC